MSASDLLLICGAILVAVGVILTVVQSAQKNPKRNNNKKQFK